ncbi:dTDP-4-dehydrorhamnose reductase [Pseudomonadales bacterium]|nr:dTDP-4-dehydrorhamnose reductase [Pseudomonadales bacterium]
MKILVIGSKGQLGCCLADQLSDTGYEVIFTSRAEIDIADLVSTKVKITALCPTIVINASAYTAVDNAEDDQIEAEKINHIAVANIANTCSEIGCWLIHISTDYVFDGVSNHPYGENAETNPQGVYGDSKLKGELAIQSSGCKYLIIRTAWVYSEYGNNFLKTMLRLGADRDELSIVGDQIGCPTYAQDIAKSIVSILSCLDLKGSSSGIYHYCGDEPCSWYDFARAIFSEAEIHGLKSPRNIKSITTVDYPTPAIRPAYSVLDCTKIESVFGVTPSNWRDGIKTATDRLQGQR